MSSETPKMWSEDELKKLIDRQLYVGLRLRGLQPPPGYVLFGTVAGIVLSTALAIVLICGVSLFVHKTLQVWGVIHG